MTKKQADALIAERVLDRIIGHIVDAEVALLMASDCPTAKTHDVEAVRKGLSRLRSQALPAALAKLAKLREDAAAPSPEPPTP